MVKKLLLSIGVIVLITACSNQSNVEQADNPLDAGRYFIENYLQGDIKKAHEYLFVDEQNEAYFEQMSKDYFSLDKEGRMQLRQTSIQINEVKTIDQNTTVIYYQLAVDAIKKWIKVVSTKNGWKVDLKFTYGPKI